MIYLPGICNLVKTNGCIGGSKHDAKQCSSAKKMIKKSFISIETSEWITLVHKFCGMSRSASWILINIYNLFVM